jgi:hypothetical protein
MAGLASDFEGRDSGLRGACSEARTQTVPRVAVRIETGSGDTLANDQADGLCRQWPGGDALVAVDAPKY